MDGPILVESPHIAGGDWNSLAEVVRKYTQKAVLEAKPSEESSQVATRLSEADMDVYGLNPLDDTLQLVTCSNCNKPIKTSRFASHWEHCSKAPRKALEEEEVLEEGTSAQSDSLKHTIKIKKLNKLPSNVKKPELARGVKRKDGDGFEGDGFSEDGDDAPAALSSAAASSYQLWLDIATKNIPLPLATKDYVRRNPLREALIANSTAAPPTPSSSYLHHAAVGPGGVPMLGVPNFLATTSTGGALTSAHLTPTAKHATLHAAATNINRKMGASPQKPAGTLPGGVAAAPAIDVSNVNRKMTGAYGVTQAGFPPSTQYPLGSSAVYIAGGGAGGTTAFGSSGHAAYGPPTTAYGAAAAGFQQQAGSAAYNSQAAFAQAAGAANAQAAGAAYPRYAYVGTPGAKPPTTAYGRTASGVTVPVMGAGTPGAVIGANPTTSTARVYYAQ